MGAWMRSTTTGHRFLTGEFTARRITDLTEAEQVTKVLGFESTVCASAEIIAELERVAENRAQLIVDLLLAIDLHSQGVSLEQIADGARTRLLADLGLAEVQK